MAFLRRSLLVFLVLVPVLVFGQTADQEVVSVTDAPDPVTPGSVLTYNVTLTNHGPNAATNGGLNVSLPSHVTYQNATVPAGFTCTAFGSSLSCTTPSFAPGTVAMTINVLVAAHLASFPDGQFTATFSPSGTTTDPNMGNNTKNATTDYNSQQVDLFVAVADAPDPVAPNNDITYTVDVTNGGPDPASNVSFNVFNNGTLRFQSITIPSGWSCPALPGVGGVPSFTCTRATWAPGTSQFLVVLRADRSVIGLNDTTLQTNFNVGAGASNETDQSDNSETESTQYVAPDADLAIAVTDSPDPVMPDGDITYTVTVTNNGPDAATDVNMNVYNNNTLRFRSATAPAGWTCNLPPLDGHPAFTCNTPTLANGASAVFTVVVRAYDEVLGVNDTTVQTNFNVHAQATADPVAGNNSENEVTQYVATDADLSIAVTDSPDPVGPDGDITYTATVTNGGPDAATNATFSVFNNNTLRFRSATVPAGWNCTLPAVDGNPTFSCTNASFGNGANAVFTVVLRAYDEIIGINDTTMQTVFTIGSNNVADPVPANNSETESTQYVTPDANLTITASDAPDPVTNGQNVTFTVGVANAGPDTAPNAQVVLAPDPSLTFQSINDAAGWSCTTPAVDSAGVVTCTKSSLVNTEGAMFTLVTKVVAAGAGGTLTSNFTVNSSVQDPVPASNSVQVTTNWIGQTSDLSITKSTLYTGAPQGSTITYTISTANNGPDAASNVTVTDVLHPALRFQSITAPAGWNCTTPAVGANGTITCTIATFANGASAQFTLDATVAPNATGSITNSATVGSATTDPTPGNSSGSAGTVAIAGNSDLGVTKTTATQQAQRGGTMSFTITVANAGPDPAASPVMTDTLPSSLLFQSIAAPAGWNCTTPAVGTSGTITCTAATLASGASAVFTLNATVAANATGTIANTATASHSGPDANPGNSSGSNTAVPLAPGSADLAATKSTAQTTVTQGQTFTYAIAVTNNGPDAAANTVMTDTLPASLLFQAIAAPAGWNCTTPAVGASGTITCTIASLATGTTANFTLTVQVASNATGTVTNRVVVSSAETDPTPGNNDVTTPPLPTTPVTAANITVDKTTTSTNVTVGTTFTYTITVSNAGPSSATNVVVNDPLPANLQFVSATPSQGTCNAASPVVCNLGTIANGGTATIALAVQAIAAGTASNSATAVAAEDAGPNSDTAPEVIVVGGAGTAAIPTLSEWALIALMLMIGAVAVIRMQT